MDAGFNTYENTDEETDPLTDSDPLDEEFHVINTFVDNVIVKAPWQPCHMLTDLPDSCLDMSAYFTQNAHGLWRLVTDSNGNQLTTSQEAKLNLTKINVATVLLLLILLQYINITELFFLDPLNLFVLFFLFFYTK